MTTIPTDYKGRLPLWVKASHKFGSANDPFTMLEIQQLGFAERLLLEMEVRAILVAKEQREKDELGSEPFLLSDLISHSRLWLFGLYESLRTYRQKVGKDAKEFSDIAEIFRQIEFARMPLAKHELKGSSAMFYPDTILNRESGRIGWNILDPATSQSMPIFRTEIADQFLAAAAT